MFSGWLTTVVFLPLVGALLIALFIRRDRDVRNFAATVSVVEFVLTIIVFSLYDKSQPGVQLIDKFENWIPVASFRVEYFLGVDGLSAPLVLLTGLLGMCAVFASWNIKLRVKEYFVWLLVLQTAVTGVFASLDFILFFIFWELELIPMYLLISIWGSGRKEYSAMKFLIFTVSGSAFMLVGILVLFFSTGTFNIVELPQAIDKARLLLPAGAIFALLFIAFAIKLPVWPVHTWLPDAHTDAPTAVSIMLAGVLLKMGSYGMIRMSVTMFPRLTTEFSWLLAALAVVNVLYGAAITLRQSDLKRLIAYSSISHMGYVLLGISSVGAGVGAISPVGLTGASLQMFTHGTITGLLFLLVGLVYDKTHTRYIPDLGGLAARMPIIASVFVLAGLASLGLPSLSGFVSELMVFLGTFPVWGWATALAAFGIVITAGYILWMLQRTFLGPSRERFAHVGDASLIEALPAAALVISIVVIGIYPAFLTDVFGAGVNAILSSRF
ncbi:MAG: NADH-quinone oxidoreductase subunit M [Chloroflexi bacterium]|nr:NADH-quinone oxidoreductase subunit M [Chloroflexota bacterium]